MWSLTPPIFKILDSWMVKPIFRFFLGRVISLLMLLTIWYWHKPALCLCRGRRGSLCWWCHRLCYFGGSPGWLNSERCWGQVNPPLFRTILGDCPPECAVALSQTYIPYGVPHFILPVLRNLMLHYRCSYSLCSQDSVSTQWLLCSVNMRGRMLS